MEINGTPSIGITRYSDMKLSPGIMKAIEKKGYVQATPVQAGAIPYFMEWKDVIAKAPTGTGKTFAFGIPMVEHIDPNSTTCSADSCPNPGAGHQIRDNYALCAFLEGCGQYASTAASP